MRNLLLALLLSILIIPTVANARTFVDKDVNPGLYSADTTEFVITEAAWDGRTYIGKKDTVSFDAIGNFFTEHLGRIYGGIQSSNLTATGQPSGLYWEWDMENSRTVMAAAIPVDDITAMIEGYEVIDIAAGRSLATDYYGPYEQSIRAHEALDAYLAEHEIANPSVVIEEYLTDPGTEPDPSKWHTRITYVFEE